MSYNSSSSARKFLKRAKKSGKTSALISPEKKPLLQIIADLLVLLLLIALPVFLYLEMWLYAGIAGGLIVISWALREFFLQDDHALVRIYGPFGRLRYLFETEFRDKYLQYFNESNTDGRPFPRIVRDYVYQKAHGAKSISSFGTELDNFDSDTTTGCRVLHRNFPGQIAPADFCVAIGELRPEVRTFRVINSINISGMSYGSINWKAAESMSLGAKDIAYINTGEGGYGPHGVGGGDVIFQIGTGKFGVGVDTNLRDGSSARKLDDDLLSNLVKANDSIGMIQIKLSQGAKPGLGGHLPGTKVTHTIAEVRRVKVGQTVISPATHVEIMAATPRESVLKLFDFIDHVRKLTERPVGIKLCIGAPDEIDLIVGLMRSTGRGPDAIQVDGADGGSGAGENIFMNYVGYGGCIESIACFDQKLKKAGIRDRVVLSASGRLLTPVHALLAFAMGAQIIDSARGPMLALGCIQSLKCHTNACPAGITTNNVWRMHGLEVLEKATRVHNYLTGFHDDLMKLSRVTGKSDPRDVSIADLRMAGHDSQFAKFYDM